jgi:tetratricopeptide (TPR) repeat protein
VLPRHQTLRAALDWSHDLLSQPEQALLRRLAVFAGGWTLEAAEQVCTGGEVERWDVLDLLAGLANKSLVLLEEGENSSRYRLLETIRQYAAERLATSGEEVLVRGKHLAWCVALLEEAEPQLKGPEQSAWLDRLEGEHDNLLAALAWSATAHAAEEASVTLGLQLAGALAPIWLASYHLSEGAEWLARMLSLGSNTPAELRARALKGAGSLAIILRDYGRAKALQEEALALFRSLGDKREISSSLNYLGLQALDQGDAEAASVFFEEALALRRELKDTQAIALLIHNIGLVAREQSDFGRARDLLEESLALARALEDRGGVANTLLNLGEAACDHGDYQVAKEWLQEGLAISRELGWTFGSVHMLGLLGEVARSQGYHEQAATLYRAGFAELRALQKLQDYKAIVANMRIIGPTDLLEGMAHVAGALGQTERGVRLFGAASALRLAFLVPEVKRRLQHEYRSQVQCEQAVVSLRIILGEEAFTSAWAEGRAMSLDEAINLALEQASATT